jgi:hypothetical protein
VSPGDAAELARAIDTVLSHDALRPGWAKPRASEPRTGASMLSAPASWSSYDQRPSDEDACASRSHCPTVFGAAIEARESASSRVRDLCSKTLYSAQP